MYFKVVLVVSLLGGALGACPPAEELFPCSCNEAKLRFYCGADTSPGPEPWDIKGYFDRVSSLVAPDFVFDEILITNTNLKIFPEGAMETIKFSRIYIEINHQLTYIHPNAFGETTNVTTYLSITYNPLLTNEGEGHSDRDMYDVISKFTAATDILISSNKLSIIPDEGFGPLPNLRNFKLGPWETVVRVGSRVFSQLPNVTTISLNSCNIDIEEIAEDAFEGIGPNVDMLLEFNPFTKMPEVPFKPLLENAKSVAVGGYECFWIGGPICVNHSLDCDEESAWICDDVEKYKSKLNGFLCPRGSGYEDIWDYCVKRVINHI